MPEVQNIGAADYTQYQTSQVPNEEYAVQNDIAPSEVYDENLAQMRAASKSRLGATLLSTAIIAGIGVGGYLIGRHGKISAKDVEKLKDSAKKYSEAQKAMEEVEKIADENAGKFFGTKRIGREFYDKIKDLFKPFKQVAEETKETAKDSAKKAA